VSTASRHRFQLEGATLNTVPAALELAKRVIAQLRSGENVHLDLEPVERLTPSVANALVMTILDEVGRAEFDAMISVAFGSELASESWTKAVQRYERGIRLSTQRQGAA
jgi:hypothetical protein